MRELVAAAGLNHLFPVAQTCIKHEQKGVFPPSGDNVTAKPLRKEGTTGHGKS